MELGALSTVLICCLVASYSSALHTKTPKLTPDGEVENIERNRHELKVPLKKTEQPNLNLGLKRESSSTKGPQGNIIPSLMKFDKVSLTTKPTQNKIVCRGKNEVYSPCVSPCAETCATLGRKIKCEEPCHPGCDCKPGFFRNSKKLCVAPSECVCPDNEEVDLCFDTCPSEDCSDIGESFDCPPVNTTTCRPACKCIRNYKRDKNRICIRIQECPDPGICNENEFFDACPDRPTAVCAEPEMECYDADAPDFTCTPQCICIPGYCKNDADECIRKRKKPSECVKNEVFDKCPGDDQTCRGYLSRRAVLNDEPDECVPGCKCKVGFVRNDAYQCVHPRECK